MSGAGMLNLLGHLILKILPVQKQKICHCKVEMHIIYPFQQHPFQLYPYVLYTNINCDINYAQMILIMHTWS